MSSHAGIGTCHSVETVKRGREKGWGVNCLGDELPLHNPKKHLLYVCHATIHEHMEFQHMRMSVNTADYQGSASALLLTLLNCI